MANQKTKEFQSKIAEQFIKSLEEDGLQWKQGWTARCVAKNGATNYKYNGVNRFKLMLIQNHFKFEDPRWYTFNQIKDVKGIYHKGQEWKLKKGSKGAQVEYAMPVDKLKNKILSWEEFHKLEKAENFDPGRYRIARKYTHVFHASQIEGVPKYIQPEPKGLKTHELINNLSVNMEVPINYCGIDMAYYNPGDDTISLPNRDDFENEYELNSTALHELAHATGASSRLNRETLANYQQIRKNPEARAKEELIAEISSTMMGCHVVDAEGLPPLENHKAYISSWISNIKEKPEFLIDAIRSSEKAVNYMEYKAGITTKEEYEKTKIYDLKKKKEIAPNVEKGHGLERVESKVAFTPANYQKKNIEKAI